MKAILSLVISSALFFAIANDDAIAKEIDAPKVTLDTLDSEIAKEPEIVEESAQEKSAVSTEYVIQNSPYLQKSSTITITATGVGVVPVSTISPAQGIALANRAALVDAYRQMGEKMHGIHLTAEDSIKNMVVQSTHIRAKVASIVKNASVIDSTFSNGLYQVTMQVKLDGKVWHNYLEQL